MTNRVRGAVRRLADRLPPRIERVLRRARHSSPVEAAIRGGHPVHWGSLRRFEPVDAAAGANRGTPIAEHYFGRFVEGHSGDVRGRVLELRAPRHASGRASVERVDVLDIDPTNENADLVADLAEEGALPPGAYDCVILPDSLRAVTELETALTNAWRSLAPHGVLLLSVPALAPARPDPHGPDRRRLLPAEFEEVLRHCCQGAEITVVGLGNLVVSIASLAGLAAEDLSREELEHTDQRYPVVVCARVTKAPR